MQSKRHSIPMPGLDTGQRDREAGFTLLEMLVVVAILGMLIGMVAPAVLRQLGGARTSIAQQSIQRLATGLDIYKLDVGSYPTSEQGLQALIAQPASVPRWNGPYLKGDATPVDSWGKPYIYKSPSTRAGRAYDLCSGGETGQTGDKGAELICNGS
jgi:general secretion pathway protein G